MTQLKQMWKKHDLKEKYDIVIIGAGVHGLAIAYYLAKRGITNIAVLDKNYLGSGNSGRNTAILRANYRTFEGIPFYYESLKLYENLSQELNYNILFSQQGHLTLGHSDLSMYGLKVRADMNKLMGVDSKIISPPEIKQLAPTVDTSSHPQYPIQGALYHPPGAVLRHDAVVWGFANNVENFGIEIHPFTEAKSILTHNNSVTGVITNRGQIKTDLVVNATAGWASTIAKMVNLDLPIVTHPLQACVTEPLKPLMHKIIVSANLHVYIYQTDRGEFVLGAEIDPYQTYSMKSTFDTLEQIACHATEIIPCLKNVNILRQWSGICDMTPDFCPIMGTVDEIKGFILDVGWGTYGFKAAPISGKMIAELISTGKTPNLIDPFKLSRFYEEKLVSEKAAAAVSH
tara:strand:+ start:589 stop:1791 length:1203 start_codon:yes stop_codon:yes gene_type:complete